MTLKNQQTAGRRFGRIGIMGGVAALALSAGTAMTAAPANAAAAPTNTWDKLAQCESGGKWGTNTGNGFGGGLQFTPSTWKAFGGKGSSHNASKAEQIRVAKKVQAGQGWGAWPACSAKLGLRGSAAANDGATSAGKSVKGSSSSYSKKYSTKKSNISSYSSKYSTQKSSAAKSKIGSGYTSKRSVPQAPVAAPSKAKHVAPSLALPANVKDSGKNYTVKAGDTLSSIAKSQGLGSWLSLYSLNKGELTSPDMIFAGSQLNLPTK
ncbi:LysM peptidoglycan-binding domain-containing protein [Galactobacter caseinivorans]|nr:transglycosylase family protein [Galactobacter caseinivorans]